MDDIKTIQMAFDRKKVPHFGQLARTKEGPNCRCYKMKVRPSVLELAATDPLAVSSDCTV